MSKRNGYSGSGYRSRKSKRSGPDFGKLYRDKKHSRLPGFFIVLLLSLGIGVGAYLIADHTLNEKEEKKAQENVTPTLVATAAPTATEAPVITETPEKQEGVVYPDGFMADFVDTRVRTDAKGIYVNTAYLGRGNYPTLDELIEMLDRTELNAMVIDIKDDTGSILFDAKHPLINEVGYKTLYITDLPAFVAKLKEHNIYCIARIVCFKDQVATKKTPALAVRNHDGSLYVDKEGERWLNPYDEKAWEYIVEVAKEAAEAGFDEINFDYLRTSASGSFTKADFSGLNEGKTKIDAITGFVKYACEQLKPMGVFVSGDVFGTIINSVADGESIGQSYVGLSRYLDYICPMVYPSHYSFGYGGLKYPDTKPFQLLLMELNSSVKKLSVIEAGEHKAEVRPWLQDFTASYLGAGRYLTYGAKELRAQISATYSAGYDEWLLWNASMFFTEEAMLRDKDY